MMHSSVAGKLTVLLAISLVVVLGTATLLNLEIQERAATKILRLNGAQLADLVAGAARESMLHNDRPRIQRTIIDLARQRDIERIRIVQKQGRIAYSTIPEEIGTVLAPSDEQCHICHDTSPPPISLTADRGARVIQDPDGTRLLAVTRVIRNGPDCISAECHFHSPKERLLGVLDVALAMEPFDEARHESALELVVAGLVGLLLVLGITVGSLQRMVHRPVRKLITGAERLARGDLSTRVPEVSRDELGALAHTFNQMAKDLEHARGELIEWGQTLEQRVELKTTELRRAQEQILQVEKMASLGKLAAEVAHEINNPLSSVVTYAKILVRRIRKGPMSNECQANLEYLEAIGSEATRCGEIVAQLLAFARRRGGEFSPVDVNQLVEKAVFLINHKLELAAVETHLELAASLPEIVADGDQVQQALLALLINACEAMEEGGQLWIVTRPSDSGITVEVRDSGPGMAPEVAQHAFEPFFSTKDKASGVGLGLSVVYGIVERHGGHIELDTTPGGGCRFVLTLPSVPPDTPEEVAS